MSSPATQKAYARVLAALRETSLLAGTDALLAWDQETMMPPKAAEGRAEMCSLIAGIAHTKATDSALYQDLQDLEKVGDLDSDQKVVVREALRDARIARALPEAYVRQVSQVVATAQEAWKQARTASDFSIFQPHLEAVVSLKRQEAAYLDPDAATPYDVLLDQYEPGMTSAQLDVLFAGLKESLSRLRQELRQGDAPNRDADFPEADQAEFAKEIARSMGYDFNAGRLDVSAHPFTTGIGPADSRITVRYDRRDIWVALGALIHEAGHALYEQGLPQDQFGNPLGEAASLGVHESQSRLWENHVGRSAAFWSYWYPRLQKRFPDLSLSREDFLRSINQVRPSLIRVEADEMTYPLHIVLRYELERALIEGTLEVADLPAAWNAKMKEYLGIEVPDDARGVLQDVHWSAGLFGYFPTYALGTLYAAQLYASSVDSIPEMDALLAQGDCRPLLDWLHARVHTHGRCQAPADLIRIATDTPPDSKWFIEYLERKYDIGS